MRRLKLIILMGVLAIAVPAACVECEPPVQEVPAMIDDIISGHQALVTDSVVPLAQPEKSEEPAGAPAESTKSDEKEKKKNDESVGKKAKKGMAALRIMGRVGSGLLKDFVEDLFS